MSPTILIAEDEARMRRILELEFSQEGWRVLLAENGDAAQAELAAHQVDLLVTDVRMGQTSGMDLLRHAREIHPDLPVIMMTAYGSVENAVEAMHLGARDYVIKPFEVEDLRLKAARALEERAVRAENRALKAQLAGAAAGTEAIGACPAMQQVFEIMRSVADTPSTVLITGESGTGKEVLACELHKCSDRSDQPFVVVNCAALTETLAESELFGHVKGAFTSAQADRIGRFELADGGTIFLDELALINLTLQGKLLRVIQEKTFERVGSTTTVKVDVRIIGATNTDLRAMIAQGTFREDLYYRLNVVAIDLPRLRDRAEDLPLLVEHFLTKHATLLGRPRPTIAPGTLDSIAGYHWPGNVRELENVIQRAILLCKDQRIGPEQLALHLAATPPPPDAGPLPDGEDGWGEVGFSLTALTEDLERRYITQALMETGGNKSRAADLLGITRKILRYKIEKYGIEAAV